MGCRQSTTMQGRSFFSTACASLAGSAATYSQTSKAAITAAAAAIKLAEAKPSAKAASATAWILSLSTAGTISSALFKSPEITCFTAVAEVSELRPAASAAARNELLATSDRIASKVATPMRIPMKRVVLARPEAMPERSGGTDARGMRLSEATYKAVVQAA